MTTKFETVFRPLSSHNLLQGTDKLISHACYTETLETILSSYDKPSDILEIGACSGASCQGLADYFPNARVVGIDLTLQHVKFGKNNERIKFIQMDARHLNVATQFFTPTKFSIIVEDASHWKEYQLHHLDVFSQLLAPGGVYIILAVNEHSLPFLQPRLTKVAHERGLAYELVDLRKPGGKPDDILATFYKTDTCISSVPRPVSHLKILCMLHIGYPDWPIASFYIAHIHNIEDACRLQGVDVKVTVTTCHDEMACKASKYYEVERISNKGVDIFPFIHELQRHQNQGFTHVIKLHTKANLAWGKMLCESFATQNNALAVLQLLHNEEIGLVGCQVLPLENAYKPKVAALAAKIGLPPANLNTAKFVGGTMFACRMDVFGKALATLNLDEEMKIIPDGRYYVDDLQGVELHVYERLFGVMGSMYEKYVFTWSEYGGW